MSDIQKLVKAVSVKSGTADGNNLICLPSILANLDLYGDVIFPGAFHKCLPMFLKRGFVPMDHEWHWSALVGFPTVAEERGNALYSEFTFHSDQQSQDAKIKCTERLAAGLEVGLSIGFSMLPGQYLYFGNGKELLAYAKKKNYDLSLFDVETITAYKGQCTAILEIEELWEYSLTPVPANQQAMAIAVKSAPGIRLSASGIRLSAARAPSNSAALQGPNKPMKLKTICGAAGMPMADEDQAWSAKDADARLRAFTGATEAPNAAYAKAFVAVDGDNDQFGSYVLPIADVVDGELKAVPKALMAAAAILNGDRAGVELSGSATQSAKTFLSAYYTKMGKDAPWTADGTVTHWKGQYLGEYIEYSMTMSALQSAWYALYYEIADALAGYGSYGAMTDAEVDAALEGMYAEHTQLCLSVIRAIRAGTGEETAEQASKSVRDATLSQLSSLGDGLAYTTCSRVAVDAARALVERTKSRIDMRLKEGRALSEANRQTLKDHRDTLENCVADIDTLLSQTETKANPQTTRDLRLQFLHLQSQH